MHRDSRKSRSPSFLSVCLLPSLWLISMDTVFLPSGALYCQNSRERNSEPPPVQGLIIPESLNGRTPAALGRRSPWGGPHLSQLLCWGRASQPFCSFICPGRVTSHATAVFSQMCCYWGALWYMEMKDAGLIQSFIIYLFIYFVLLLIVKLPSTLWQPRQKSCDASSFLQE